VTYDFDASATQNATQFSWSFGDGNFGTGSFTTHTYVSNGTYQARLYASTPCVTDTATATIVIHQISLDEPHSRPGLRIFPNPTKNLLAIEGAGLSAISIFGATGVLLFETTNAIESNLTTIDVSTWPAGVYYLHANVQGSIQVRSFVIMR
jgi:PKD repeat protein